MGTQTIVPNQDISTGSGWERSVGTGDLYPLIASNASSGYIYGHGSSGVAKFGLTSPAEPPAIDSGHRVKFNAQHFNGPSGTTQVTVTLMQGSSTVIRAQTFTLTNSIQEKTVELLEAEAALITDYDDLQLWFDVVGTSANTNVGVFEAHVEVPDQDIEISGEVASMTLSVVDGETSIIFLTEDVTVTMTMSVVAGDVEVTAQMSRWRDVFLYYNSPTDQFHIGVVDVTHSTELAGADSVVDANHLVIGVSEGSLQRMRYEHSFPSAFIQKESLTTAEVGGEFRDRPNSVIFGYWSWGSYPTYDTENPVLLYEASIPRDLTERIETDRYPYYGSVQPEESNWILFPSHDFDDPFTVKRLSRVWVLLPVPPSQNEDLQITITARPTPTDAQGNLGKEVSRTITVAGYDNSEATLAQPVRLVYADFDPVGDPSGNDESVAGLGFEIKVEIETGIGIYQVIVDAEGGGQHDKLDSQA